MHKEFLKKKYLMTHMLGTYRDNVTSGAWASPAVQTASAVVP
ncbi:hypothetical protein HanRHA438_Chr08g0370611 [Helianthus annuus]|nr:hypothetical protein HanRHA438_Chr08g0370611 [Helianthus annuus]